jgi:lactate 2-monooxygenase
VTADTFSLGWRPADLDTAYLPFIWGTGCAIGFSDPVFQRKYAEAQAKANKENAKLSIWRRIKDTITILLRPRNLFTTLRLIWNVSTVKKSQAWIDVAFSSTYRTWEELPILRKHWPGPIVIKGIQTVEDAHKCIDSGMDGFVVSNHGGRQVDSAVASLDALAAIGDDERVKSSGITVLFDSGIRNGSDVLKALALGAKAVLLGRPYMYGLAIAGQEGVEHVVRTILGDMDNTLVSFKQEAIYSKANVISSGSYWKATHRSIEPSRFGYGKQKQFVTLVIG